MNTQNAEEFSEIMTLSEIARYLKVSEKTVTRMVKAGDLPGGKVSSQWRFQKTVIDNWLTAKIQEAQDEDLTHIMASQSPILPLPRLIPDEHILLDIHPGSKRQVLSQLVRPLMVTKAVLNPGSFLMSLMDREDMVSTALTDGVALPHVRDQKTSGVKETTMVLGVCAEGTDVGAMDGKPTRLFFLLCATDAAKHLRLMAKLTLMLRRSQMVERFCACTSVREIKDLLTEGHLDLSIKL
jgi:PTS system nitrogen regulatory IIA component